MHSKSFTKMLFLFLRAVSGLMPRHLYLCHQKLATFSFIGQLLLKLNALFSGTIKSLNHTHGVSAMPTLKASDRLYDVSGIHWLHS